jgi:sulfatase maturation enzyme AslB (radical SAM superfamily)
VKIGAVYIILLFALFMQVQTQAHAQMQEQVQKQPEVKSKKFIPKTHEINVMYGESLSMGILSFGVTNGYACNADIHSRLLSAGVGAVTLSLDGLADSHNWLRKNPHSFEHAVAALDLIVANSSTAMVSILYFAV